MSESTSIITTVPDNILEFNNSFGYDCKRLFNLVLIDDDTLVFASGNLVHYYQISTNQVTFRHSTFGQGIGFILKNPSPQHEKLLTIAENGREPTVFFYEFPSHRIMGTLEGAAKEMFTCGSFNSDGSLLATQAGQPDYMLTIWKWETASVILRSKSFQNDVLTVKFSLYNPILLTSCGLGHVKFWKMANTFTGLKLQGDLGRFGKTDICDVYAIYMLSDEKVISGCEWGNMLVWEAGLIKVEVCRKGRVPCHTHPITQISMDGTEVTTVGMDGFVRIWFWETVELADPPDDDRFVEIEPIYEFFIDNCEIREMVKIKPMDRLHYGYYVQDGKGGVWYFDLNTEKSSEPPRKLYSCHGGRIVSAAASPSTPHLLTLGEDGKMFMYDYQSKKLLLEKQFPSGGTKMLWLGLGMEVIAGFEDGVLRHAFFQLKNGKEAKMFLINAIKAHTAAITAVSLNPNGHIIVTGSKDKTIFLYLIERKIGDTVNLIPMGFIELEAIPSAINWKHDEDATILIGFQTGEVFECPVPTTTSPEQTYLTYRLPEEDEKKTMRFVSVKSQIRREIKRLEIKKRKDLKRERKLKELEKLKQANPGLQIDEESALADSEEDEPEEPLYMPEIPNTIIWLKYTTRNTIWLSMSGYDAGYIYEFAFGHEQPVRSTLIADADDCEIHSYLNINDMYLLLGMQTGQIRVNAVKKEFTDLHDYRCFDMHDNLNGVISNIFLSFDANYLFSVGYDGNIFSYKWNGPKPTESAMATIHEKSAPPKIDANFPDITDPKHLTLEEQKIQDELLRQQRFKEAEQKKFKDEIAKLQVEFNEIIRQNKELPDELKLTDKEMELDPRITKEIADELQAELDASRQELDQELKSAQEKKQVLIDYFFKGLDYLPFEVPAVSYNSETVVRSFRVQQLGEDIAQAKLEIEEQLRLEAAAQRHEEIEMPESEEDVSIPEPSEETFFLGLDPDQLIPKFSKKMLRLLFRYRNRQMEDIRQQVEWKRLLRNKPDPNQFHIDDIRAIEEAKRTIGDYKLKTDPDYEPKATDNLVHKYAEIIACRERIVAMQNAYNEKVLKVREEKKVLYAWIAEKRRRFEWLHHLIPAKNHKAFPQIREINSDKEYPDTNIVDNCRTGCGLDIKDILFTKKPLNDLKAEQFQTKPAPERSEEEQREEDRYLSWRMHEVDYLPEPEELSKIADELPPVETAEDYEYYSREDTPTSPLIVQKRYGWLLYLCQEQDEILVEVEYQIQKFDEALRKLAEYRMPIELDVECLESHMITMNQELYILRDSEEIEKKLQAEAHQAMSERNAIQVALNALNRQIDESRRSCDKMNEQIRTIQATFLETVRGNKFFDFLRRIFKKKYKPPKPPKGDDESSESSSSDESSSEEEEDAADDKSVDSTDMTVIRLDEDICPEGCDRQLYDMTFQVRGDRHKLEQDVYQQQKLAESKRREIDEMRIQMKAYEETYTRQKDKLLEFRRKRQQELNKVLVTVVLSTDQIQHFKEGEDYRDVSKAVLFDTEQLLRLQNRVGQLKEEERETKRLHRINIVHLRRLKTDIAHMRREVIRLEADIKDAMIRKFGMVIDLDEVEDAVLRKYVFDLETNSDDSAQNEEKELARQKAKLASLEEELIRETQLNTEKLNVFTVLQEEINFLNEVLLDQEKNYEKSHKPESFEISRDIERLLIIDRRQKEEIKRVEKEILMLRLKGKPLLLETGSRGDEIPSTAEGATSSKTCPEIFSAEALRFRSDPEHIAMERIEQRVQTFLVRHLASVMSTENIQKYAVKVARYLSYAGYRFEGELTDRIMDCITEHLQTLLPKKYMLHITAAGLRTLFNEILDVFDYERSDVTTEEVILGIFANAIEKADEDVNSLNKTQIILVEMFKQMIEVLPLEDFQSDTTFRTIVDLLQKDERILPKCISVEMLVQNVISYAQENLLDMITAIPIRRLADNILKELMRGTVRSGSKPVTGLLMGRK